MSVDALGRAASIHYVMLPEPDLYACCDDPVIRRQMARLMMAIEMGRVLRERRTISLKMPVRRSFSALLTMRSLKIFNPWSPI